MSVFDEIHACDFTLAYRPSSRDVYTEVGKVRLNQIRKAKAKDTRMIVSLEMDKALNGKLSAWDTLIRRRNLLEFNVQLVRNEMGLTEMTP